MKRDLEMARLHGFKCFEPDGSQGSYEVLEEIQRGELDEDTIPCYLCRLNNTVGKYGCPWIL